MGNIYKHKYLAPNNKCGAQIIHWECTGNEVGMGWEWGGNGVVHQWDPLGHFWKFARNPRSPLGILGIHWESTGKGGSVISTVMLGLLLI